MNEDSRAYEVGPDEAFIKGLTGGELFGEPLRSFSFSRKIAAQSMGCIAPAVPSLAEHMSGTGTYPGALNDMIIVTWLRTVKDNSEITGDEYRTGAFTPERATNQPGQAVKAAHAWAEAKGLDGFTSEIGFAAWKEFLQTMFGIDASAFEVEVEATGEPENGQSSGPKETPGSATLHTSYPASRGKRATTRNMSGKK